MSIDFGALPPEINSARLYSGAGSSSLVAAASAWNSVAAELTSTALQYDAVVTQLTGEEWLGSASSAAAAAASPYAEWLSNTATLAEQASGQASAAAAAYESAITSIVPTPLIAANRAELAQAQATNVIGQNTGIIAQLEAQYGEFWAQDAETMYTYATNSASAANVTTFTAAPTVASPTAAASQAAAAVPSATSVVTQLNQQITAIYQQLQALGAPLYAPFQQEANFLTGSSSPFSPIYQALFGSASFPASSLSSFMSAVSPYAGVFYNVEGLPYFSIGMGNFMTQIAKTTGTLGGALPAAASVPKGLPALGGLLGGGAAHVAGSLGNAGSVGKLSVPVSWTGGLESAHHTASAIPVSNVREAPDAAPGNLLGGMPLAGTGVGHGAGAGPRYGFKPTVMARPPAAG